MSKYKTLRKFTQNDQEALIPVSVNEVVVLLSGLVAGASG